MKQHVGTLSNQKRTIEQSTIDADSNIELGIKRSIETSTPTIDTCSSIELVTNAFDTDDEIVE